MKINNSSLNEQKQKVGQIIKIMLEIIFLENGTV